TYRKGRTLVCMIRILDARIGHEMPVNDMATKLGCSRRTVLRYIDLFSQPDSENPELPVLERRYRDGRAYVAEPDPPRTLSTAVYNYAATFAATRALASSGAEALSVPADGVLSELRKGLGPGAAAKADRIRTAFHYQPFAPKDYGTQDDILDPLVVATLTRRPVTVQYRDRAGNAFERSLEPFTLVLYRDGLYVLGRVETANEGLTWRLFAVDRISAITPDKTRHFTIPPDFDAATILSNAFGLWPTPDPPLHVRLAFSQRAAPDIRERHWPGNATLSEHTDGRLLLELHAPDSPELGGWILSWGPEVELLEPEELRLRIRDSLARTAMAYESGSSSGTAG
ncbi:MAG: WYL domain-containing protein, partial [Myxococcota bacterium]|nr:WYL domain-containing protein [Myxococcota bacterium]